MNSFHRIVTLTLLLAAAPARAQNASTNTVPTMSLDQLLAEIKASTGATRAEGYAQLVAQFQPKTEQDVALLLGALNDPKLAPYAQQSVARATDPSLGAKLHEGLKALMTGLKHIPTQDFGKLNLGQQDAAMRTAMNVSAVSHALGNVKYQPAAADLRDLLAYDEEFEGSISWEASRALGEMGDEQAFQMLATKLGQNKPINISGFGTRGIRIILDKVDAIRGDL